MKIMTLALLSLLIACTRSPCSEESCPLPDAANRLDVSVFELTQSSATTICGGFEDPRFCTPFGGDDDCYQQGCSSLCGLDGFYCPDFSDPAAYSYCWAHPCDRSGNGPGGVRCLCNGSPDVRITCRCGERP